jgi:N utilization substance protein A
MVVSELRGEKIDIIPYNDEPARFVAKALSPARVREVLVDDEKQESTVIVPDDQLSLAIGREGQNARLAAKLTGWKVDIKSETEFSQEEEEIEFEEGEEADGRCAAVLSAGRRCPNAALSGSRYCGLPQHQALARFATNQVTVLTPLADQEIQRLADSSADDAEIGPLVERATAEFEAAERAAAESTEADAEQEAEEEAEELDEAATDDAAAAEAEEITQAEEELEEAEEDAAEAVGATPAAEVEQEASQPEEADESVAGNTAAESPDDGGPPEETAQVGAKAPEESEAQGQDSEGSDSSA